MELMAANPLNATLVLKDITVNIDGADDVSVETVSELVLEAYETRLITIAVTVNKATTVTITHATFLFHRFFPCIQSLLRKGKRLHATKAQRINPTYGTDTTLTVEIKAARPSLAVELTGVPDVLYEGEEVEGMLRMTNTGRVTVEDVWLMLSEAGVVRLRRKSMWNCVSFSIH
jgi:hypothetical protein